MKVENIVNSRGNTVANQFIVSSSNDKTFQSYESRIAVCIDFNRLRLEGEMWDYSNTTRKYFKQFINEETPFTYENKAQWLKEIENNPQIEVI